MSPSNSDPAARRRVSGETLDCMLAAIRVGAIGNESGRPQNGTAVTGKPLQV